MDLRRKISKHNSKAIHKILDFQQQAPQQQAPQQGGYAPQGQQSVPQQAYNKPPQQSGYAQAPQQQAPQQGGYAQQNQQQGGFSQPAQQQAPKVNPQEPSIDFDDDIPF